MDDIGLCINNSLHLSSFALGGLREPAQCVRRGHKALHAVKPAGWTGWTFAISLLLCYRQRCHIYARMLPGGPNQALSFLYRMRQYWLWKDNLVSAGTAANILLSLIAVDVFAFTWLRTGHSNHTLPKNKYKTESTRSLRLAIKHNPFANLICKRCWKFCKKPSRKLMVTGIGGSVPWKVKIGPGY